MAEFRTPKSGPMKSGRCKVRSNEFATHRHKDHVSGFSNAGGKESAGAIIPSCKPEVVLQPWTENPDAAANATSAPLLAKQRAAGNKQLYFASLSAMNAFAEAVVRQAARWRGVSGRSGMLEKLAANAVKNPDAVKNLRTMGKKPARFLQYGSKSGLEGKLLPGVKVYVLGPPTLEQQNIKKYAKNSDEYWLASKYWGLQERAVALAGARIFFRERDDTERNPGRSIRAGSVNMPMLRSRATRWQLSLCSTVFSTIRVSFCSLK